MFLEPSYIWLMTYLDRIILYICLFCLFPVHHRAYIITLQLYLWIYLWALVLYGSYRFSWWSIWMWRTAGVLQSHQRNFHTPAQAASLLHFLQKRNHRGQSSHSSSKGQFIEYLYYVLSCPFCKPDLFLQVWVIFPCDQYERLLERAEERTVQQKWRIARWEVSTKEIMVNSEWYLWRG